MKKFFTTLLTLAFVQFAFTVPTYAGDIPVDEVTENQVRLININTADETELRSLPGIGRSKAQAIIDYRESYGAFSSVTEITNVKGIGNKLLEKLKSQIAV